MSTSATSMPVLTQLGPSHRISTASLPLEDPKRGWFSQAYLSPSMPQAPGHQPEAPRGGLSKIRAPGGNHQMARIERYNEKSVREGYVRDGGKKVKLFTSALKAFQCNNRIVMAQRKHLDDFLRRIIIGRLECGRTQLEVSEELGSPRVSSPGFGKDSKMMVINIRSTASDLSRQLSSATGATVLRQTVYRRLGHIGLYARRSVRCVPLTANHSRLRLTWSREHALWTLQQWSCVIFSTTSPGLVYSLILAGL
ncbi:transposable element Tcb1 transposase [Trichonephila clavipes]|nr:transposable element Tcb1 transposase [Trichonephila clavipes]